MKKNQEPETAKNILKSLGLHPEWKGRRGPKSKYLLRHLRRNEFLETPCDPARSRAVQTAILKAGRAQKVKIQTENRNTFILTKRIR
jgi:hypothetical protein